MDRMPAGYAGTYRSDELAASFVVTVAEDLLRIKLSDGQTRTLRRIGNNIFLGGGVTLHFEPPRDGHSAGFSFDQGRVRGIRFVRTSN
jgi:hypothetical protein